MNIQKISVIPFSAKTDEGNYYKKSNAGKLTGIAGGIGFASYSIYKAKQIMNTPEFKKEIEKPFKELSLPQKDIKKYMKLGNNIGFGITIAIFATIGLGLGAIADAIINSYRRNKADELAENIVNK